MQSLPHVLAELNPQQREAALHEDGPLLLVAGPGSGKTKTITVRAARLFADGICQPDELTAVTFTNKAAAEMRHRLRSLIGSQASGANLRTFHSMCLWILRRHSQHLDGFTRRFVVYDEKDSLRALRFVIQRDKLPDLKAEDVATQIDAWKNMGVRPEDLTVDSPTRTAYFGYQERLRDSDAMDFGDLLVECVRLFESCPDVLDLCRENARFLMVDEYQDTNPIQYQLVSLLGGWGTENVCVVGDPDQSIYGFRGATISNILSFTSHFPRCRVIRLERNYRSTPTIVAAASALIANNSERIDKEMIACREHDEPILVSGNETVYNELDRTAGLIEQQIASGFRPMDIAVIARTRALVTLTEESVRRRGIPCEAIGAVGFYERKEVRDVLAFIRTLYNPRDSESVSRIINTPPRGIGKKTMTVIWGVRHSRESFIEAAGRAIEEGHLRTREANAVQAFIDTLWRVTQMPRETSPDVVFDELLVAFGYRAMLSREPDDAREGRIIQLRDRLVEAGETTQSESFWDAMGAFLDTVFLDTAGQDSGDRDRVQILTAHKSKGLEFPVVFVAGFVDGVMPHALAVEEDRGMEEERRLAFVAMTRAMNRLVLCWHRSAFTRDGDVLSRSASPFLHELPRNLLEPARRTPATLSPLFGRFVEHPTFGRGLVVDQTKVSGDPDPFLVVRFLDEGRKKVHPDSVRLSALQ